MAGLDRYVSVHVRKGRAALSRSRSRSRSRMRRERASSRGQGRGRSHLSPAESRDDASPVSVRAAGPEVTRSKRGHRMTVASDGAASQGRLRVPPAF